MQDSFHESLASNLIIFRNYLKMGPIRYLKTAKYMIEDHLEAYIKNAPQPILLIKGSKDKIAPKIWLEELNKRTKLSVFSEIQDAPHAAQLSEPSELVDLVHAFIGADTCAVLDT